MDNNTNNNPSNAMAVMALVFSAAGTLMSILGTAFTCSCSASKTFAEDSGKYQTSLVMILAILGAVIALVGAVFAILALKNDRKNVLALISLALGVFGFAIGFLPAITICGYNCSLEGAKTKFYEDALGDIFGSLGGF